MSIHFYDSASPQNIPSGVHAQVYINGYAWPDSEIKRMGAVYRTSVLQEAHWAQWASEIDVENGAATPADALAFVKFRRLHYDDAKVYVNRSNWLTVAELFRGCDEKQPHYRVATLDGTVDVTLDLDGEKIEPWAVQYYGGENAPYDLSVLKGVYDFHKPGVMGGPYGT